jgi:hypothetical protein
MGMSTLSLEVTSNKSIAKAKEEVELLTKGRLDIVSANTFPLISYMDEQADYCLSGTSWSTMRTRSPPFPLSPPLGSRTAYGGTC